MSGQQLPELGQRYSHRPGLDDRTVTVTGLKEAPDGPHVSYEWCDNGPGTLRGCVPVDVFNRVYQPEQPAADTLPAWLHKRFGPSLTVFGTWEELEDSDRAYWEHEAAAVRRAVARGGFKNPAGGEV